MNLSSISRRTGACVVWIAASVALTGCYVVPLQPHTSGPAHIHVPVPAAAPGPVTFTARLYPSNEQASRFGIVGAVVTNDLNGRGRFTTQIDGETFTGEATRKAGSQREGVANGAGSRGGFIYCNYIMNTETLGTGSCRHSSDATFTMHVGH